MELKKKVMIAALEKHLGIVLTAVEEADISRSTHYKWYREDEEYRAAVNDVENIALDFAESKLHERIRSGDTIATIFYLKTKGKKRGYVEKYELDAKFEEVKPPSWFVSQDHIMITKAAQKES